MGMKSSQNILTAFVGLFVFLDMWALSKHIANTDLVLIDWGVVGRIILPLFFYFAAFRSKKIRNRVSFLLFGTSRLIDQNIIALNVGHFEKTMLLSIVTMIDISVVLLLIFYKSEISSSNIMTNRSSAYYLMLFILLFALFSLVIIYAKS